jgi:photosystem II stability/assembly factor-like uncharacterized protein
MASIIHLLFTFSLIVFLGGQALLAQEFPWYVQTTLGVDPGGTIAFRKIAAPDTLHAMALGFGGSNNAVARTTNGGASWDIPLARWDKEDKLRDLSHPTPRVAVVVGDTMRRVSDTGSTIFYTHDGGDTWQQAWCDSCIRVLPSGIIRYPSQFVSLSDSSNGILAGGRLLVARTTDGGVTWRRATAPNTALGEFFSEAQCISSRTWLLSIGRIGPNTLRLVRTDNAGQTWDSLVLPPYTQVWAFIDSLRGWSAASWNVDSVNGPMKYMVFRTLDGGRTWDTLYNRFVESRRPGITDADVSTISMADATHGIIICSQGPWLYTRDGTTWHEGPNIDSVLKIFTLSCLTYPHPGKAWAGSNGYIVVYNPQVANAPELRNDPASTALAAYPNPVSNTMPMTISITFDRSARTSLSLVDMRGTTIEKFAVSNVEAGTHQLTWQPGTEIPAGIYFLRLVHGSDVYSLPVTILH